MATPYSDRSSPKRESRPRPGGDDAPRRPAARGLSADALLEMADELEEQGRNLLARARELQRMAGSLGESGEGGRTAERKPFVRKPAGGGARTGGGAGGARTGSAGGTARARTGEGRGKPAGERGESRGRGGSASRGGSSTREQGTNEWRGERGGESRGPSRSPRTGGRGGEGGGDDRPKSRSRSNAPDWAPGKKGGRGR